MRLDLRLGTSTAIADAERTPDHRGGVRIGRLGVLAEVDRARAFTLARRLVRLVRTARVPAKPRWLLAIPDAISQLEKLDRTLLTRRDIERLFGVSTARAATLMQTFGAEMTGYQRTLPRTKLLRQLRKHRARSAFRGEEERRDRLVAELRKARVTGIRVTLPVETLDAKLASLPEGVSVSRDRIEVRFSGAKEAVERLYALAYALVNDYERFEELVDGGAGGGGEVSE